MPDWKQIREDFPALKRFRYLSSASGGPMPRPVYEKAIEYYRDAMEVGDSCWEKNLERREEIRTQAAGLIGSDPDDVEFIPSTAAGMHIITGLLADAGSVLATPLEFPDSTLPWFYKNPDRIRWVQPDASGAVPAEKYRSEMSNETGVIMTSHVQFSNGFRQDVEELGRIKENHFLVVNATQSLGAFQVDVRSMAIDALCGNSYKWMLGGYGCGLLYVSKSLSRGRIGPGVGWFAVKDKEQFRNDGFEFIEGAGQFNWGSPAFPTIFALGAAIEYLRQIGMAEIENRILELNRYLTDQLAAAGFRVLSPMHPEKYRSGATLVHLDRPAETVKQLWDEDILCTEKPEGMRVATHFFNSAEDVDVLVTALKRLVG